MHIYNLLFTLVVNGPSKHGGFKAKLDFRLTVYLPSVLTIGHARFNFDGPETTENDFSFFSDKRQRQRIGLGYSVFIRYNEKHYAIMYTVMFNRKLLHLFQEISKRLR